MGTSFDNIGAKISDGFSDVADKFTGNSAEYKSALAKAEADYYSGETKGKDGVSVYDDESPDFDKDAFREKYYKKSIGKAASSLGEYKEKPQEKTAVARSNAPKQGISGPKGYGRGEQAEPYEQMQRGMSTGDLEKMLLEAMRSNARMSIFQGGFKGGLL
tara:strand:+ start:130 stop:609 length:480 start_codon:yes stop_codon:yes gene_type:complete